jgi:hypothetical protein
MGGMRGRTIARLTAFCLSTLLALGALLTPALACPPPRGIEQEFDRAAAQAIRKQRREWAEERAAAAREVANDDTRFAAGILVAVFAASLIVVAAMNVDARRSLHRRLVREAHGHHASGLEPLDATLVAQLARDRLMRACAFAIAALGGAWLVLATMPAQTPAPHMLLLAPAIAIWVRANAAIIRTVRVLARLRAPGITTQYDGSRFVFVLAGDELLGWIVAWPVTLRRVRERGVPAARVRR